MTEQEILDNAPEDSTHYVLENGTNFYFKIDDKEASIYTDEWDCYTNHKDVIPDLIGIRSLADIKRIAELEKTCKSRSDTIIEYSNKIAKLEVKLTSANNIIKIMYMGEDDE